MKTQIGVIGAALVILGMGPWAAAAEMKIGTVDAERLIKGYHKTELMQSHLEDQAADISKEGDKMLTERRRLKGEFDAMRNEARNRARSEDARDKQMQMAEDKLIEIMEYEQRIRDTSTMRRKQFDDERQRMQKKLVDEIRDMISEYARENGYSLIVDSSGITTSGFPPAIFALDSMDITAAIEKQLMITKTKTGD